jgi:hypothetical protein
MSTNPKDRLGAAKLPLHLFPATAIAAGSVGMLNGALKYGRSNFRATPVRATVYVDAALRHLHAWADGEDADPDDGVPHLCAVLANLAIMVDAQAQGTLIDDRNYGDPQAHRAAVDALTAHVSRLLALHAQRDPKHYSRLADVEKGAQ